MSRGLLIWCQPQTQTSDYQLENNIMYELNSVLWFQLFNFQLNEGCVHSFLKNKTVVFVVVFIVFVAVCYCCFGLICAVFVDIVVVSPVINADELTLDSRATRSIAAALCPRRGPSAGKEVDLHLPCSSWRSGGQQRCSRHTRLLAQRKSGAMLQELRVCGQTKIHTLVRLADGNTRLEYFQDSCSTWMSDDEWTSNGWMNGEWINAE